jgi:hypothetical protein
MSNVQEEEKNISKGSKIKEHILANQLEDNETIADKFKTTKDFVSKLKSELRKDGKLPKLEEGYRQKKTEEKHIALAEECKNSNIPFDSVKHGWYKGEHFSLFFNKQVTWEDLKEEIVNEVKQYAPKYPNIFYPNYEDAHLLVVSPADIHINKLCSAFETGDEYNIDIAINRVKDGIASLLNKVRFYNIDKVLLIIGNDILHTDNPQNTTTAGTRQDTQIMWYDAFLIAKKLIIWVIETLSTIAPLQVDYNPSNHDYMTGFLLAQTLEAWFSKCEHITFNVTMSHRKYFVYGQNLIGSTHGDGAKETDLALLMAHEAGESWYKCKFRYYYSHHIHHKKTKDYMSVTVESMRSASGADSWHHRNGYVHSPKAIDCYLHHPTQGQIGRFTHYF